MTTLFVPDLSPVIIGSNYVVMVVVSSNEKVMSSLLHNTTTYFQLLHLQKNRVWGWAPRGFFSNLITTNYHELLRITTITTITTNYFPGQLLRITTFLLQITTITGRKVMGNNW